MPSVFLSHNSKDKPFVRQLATRLSDEGVVVWLDEAVLNIGDSLIEKISEGIKGMDYVAAVISKNSVASAWVQKELSLAMTKEIAGRKVVVLPIVIDDCDLPDSLGDKLYADFRDPSAFDASFGKLLKAIGISTTPSPAAHPKELVNGIEDIRIIGVDKDRTYNPDPRKAMFDVYLELSTIPPTNWYQFFDRERSFARHNMWRNAYLDGRYIVVHCPLDEVGKYHLRDLKEDVANANQKYRQAIAAHQQQVERELERQRIEEQARNEVLDALDFS